MRAIRHPLVGEQVDDHYPKQRSAAHPPFHVSLSQAAQGSLQYLASTDQGTRV
jgi:hypothetical protein